MSCDDAGQPVVLADELGDEGILRALIELGRGRELLHDAVIEHGNAVRHGQRLGLIMRHIDDGYAQALMQMADLILHLLAQLLVERAQGLVHQHEIGIEDQRPGDGNALLLAAGELARAAVAEARQLDHLERSLHPLFDLGLVQVADLKRKGQVLVDRHMREERIVLEYHADAALMRRHAVDGLAVQEDLAVGGGLEAREHQKGRRLAGTRRAQHGDEFALGDIQIEILNDQGLAVITLLHVHEANHGLAAGR